MSSHEQQAAFSFVLVDFGRKQPRGCEDDRVTVLCAVPILESYFTAGSFGSKCDQ